MLLPTLALPLLLGLAPASPDPGPLFKATGMDPYFAGKTGFRDVTQAVDDAVAEFREEVGKGSIIPDRVEFFSYIYTFQEPGDGQRVVFFHSRWEQASEAGTAVGSHKFLIQSPVPENASVKIFSFIHSHPTAMGHGEGPSRVDVALASKFKDADGRHRYLYLINNQGSLVRFKARRDIDPSNQAALSALPALPRRPVDWTD